MTSDRQWKVAACAFVLAVAAFWFGVVMAAHYFPTQPYDWMYRVVAGINLTPERPGYQRIVFRPRPGGTLTWAAARLDSLYGSIESRWTRTSTGLDLTISVPPNAEGEVHLPAQSLDGVTESGLPLADAPGVRIFSEVGGEPRLAREEPSDRRRTAGRLSQDGFG